MTRAVKVDLTGERDLHVQHREWLDEIARDLRRPFTELVERLSTAHGRNIDWWVTPLASRNTFASGCFLRCCQLLLAKRIAEATPQVEEFVVNSAGLARTLRRMFASGNAPVRVRLAHGWWRSGLRPLASTLFRFAAAVFHCLAQALFARIHRPRAIMLPDGGLILIDTFLYSNSLEGSYRDRHYPGLVESLDPDQRQRVFFLPTYYGIRNYSRLFRRVRGSAENFLVKEDYLHWSDYGFALGHPFRVPEFRVGSCDFQGIDVAPLINEAIMESVASPGSIEGLLRYRLARRLAERSVKVKLVIDWFENQELDHGSNAGIREFLPDAVVIGYQGFVVPNTYLCLFPTSQEAALRLIPHRIAVIGSAFVAGAKEFFPEADVVVAPAFRFTKVWKENPPRARTEPLTVLVPLPFLQRECEQILKLLNAALAALARDGSETWRLRLKLHPIVPAAQVAALLGSVARHRFTLVSDDIDDLLREADILVSSTSSVCMQALAYGVPVVVIGSQRGLTQNPIPEWVDTDTWVLCHTAQELAAALGRLAQSDETAVERCRATGRGLREACFEPVTRESVARFLMLDAPAGKGAA